MTNTTRDTTMRLAMGEKVCDVITGFKGRIVAKCQYINGCDQCLVKPSIGEDGKMPVGEWIDDQQLELQKTRKSPKAVGSMSQRGGGGGIRETPPEIGGSE